MTQGVYRIRNKVNDKRYTGSTNDFEGGWIIRRQALRKGEHHNPYLQNAWNKYGEENFAFEIEEEVKGDQKIRLDVEQVYLDEGFKLGNLYNIARKAGGGNLGGEVNQKISKANSGENHPNYGKHCSEETRAKMSKAKLGENNSMYGKFGKNNPMYGKHRTEKTKVKLRKASKGNESAAKLYPAFYNIKTKEYIPAGINLARMCKEYGLQYLTMHFLQHKRTKQSRDGWLTYCEMEN